MERAIKILEKKWKLEYKLDPFVIELFKKASEEKPPIKPYHISHLNLDFLHFFDKVIVEPKYDGTHIQISKFGIFNHSGKQIAEDQLAMILHLTTLEEFQEILNSLDTYVFGIEVFGRKYTPGGYHKNHDKKLDFVIFDVGIEEDGKWYWDYNSKKNFKKVVRGVEINVRNPEEAFKEIVSLSLRKDFFEGCVVKNYNRNIIEDLKDYLVDGGLYIAKYKGKSYSKAPEEFRGREDLFDEIVNEIKKFGVPRSKREKDEISKKIVDYLFNSHPEIVKKYRLKRSKLDAIVKKVINWYILETTSK